MRPSPTPAPSRRIRRLLVACCAALATLLALGGTPGTAYAALAAPAAPTAIAKTSTSLSLKWPAVKGAPAYRVKYSTSSSFSRPRYRELPQVTTVLTGLAPQQTYYVKVRIVTAAGKELTGYGKTLKVTTAAKPVAKPLRVGSYNVRCATCFVAGGEEGTWEQRRGAVVAAIKAEDLDVLGVQEASQGWLKDADGKKFSLSQFEDLAARLGGPWRLTNSKRNNCVKDTTPSSCVYADQGASLGTRVLYNSARIKLVRSGSEILPATDVAGGRHYLSWAELQQVSTGRKFILANTHLSPDAKNYQLRAEQATVAMAEVKAKNTAKLPMISVGDFNSDKFSSPANAPYDVWRKGGFVDPLGNAHKSYGAQTSKPTVESRTQTWLNSFNGFRRHANGHPTWVNGTYIDYILTTPMRVSEWETVARLDAKGDFVGQIPSDHNMVRATVWLPV